MLESFANFLQNTGLYALISSGGIDAVKTIIMIAIACVLLYLAIVKEFEPLLLLPIAFGMLLVKPADVYGFRRNYDAHGIFYGSRVYD